MSYEYSIRIPEGDRAIFRQWTRKMGWRVSRPKKVMDEPNEETIQAIKAGVTFDRSLSHRNKGVTLRRNFHQDP